MTTKQENSSKVAVVEKESTSVIVAESETSVNNGSTSSANASSAQQLIRLAKNFSIEGGLLPQEKQMPIADRAIKRERLVNLRQQNNLESIITKAIEYCDDENAVSKTDHDWFSSFISLAENISNTTMQGLWAKILAGEVSKPGSFSFKALKVFKNMSIRDAKLFAKACYLACNESQKNNYRIITGASQQPSLFNIFDSKRQQVVNLNTFGLSYGDILSLAENNLIFSQETETNTFSKGNTLVMDYNGMPLMVTATRTNTVLSFYKFTPAGTELARLINESPEMAYLKSLKSQLSHHFSIQTKTPEKD